jgi:hypothetical protein
VRGPLSRRPIRDEEDEEQEEEPREVEEVSHGAMVVDGGAGGGGGGGSNGMDRATWTPRLRLVHHQRPVGTPHPASRGSRRAASILPLKDAHFRCAGVFVVFMVRGHISST